MECTTNLREWLDAFRTIDWKGIKSNLEYSGLMPMLGLTNTLGGYTLNK